MMLEIAELNSESTGAMKKIIGIFEQFQQDFLVLFDISFNNSCVLYIFLYLDITYTTHYIRMITW